VVRERTDLVKVVGQYLTLRKAGHDSLVGLCPFHTEKTASFSVSPSKQVYYCFGCGSGGDAVRFLMGVEALAFPEAIERLARDAGITLRYEGDSPGERRAASRRQSLHRANAEAADLYRRTLLEGREAAAAREYLEGRGFDRGAIEEYGIGYAPSYPDFLLRRLSGHFSPELLVEAGLALREGSGGVRDRFRSRITFPVHDLAGHAVGMGARLLSGEGPKYLNSPETPIYKKARVLYNLHRAKGAVTRGGTAVVVEGYTDVIALGRAGVESAVATCGTALGEEHFQLLSRFARRVVLAFDSDEAGARAAERAYRFHERYPLEAVVLVLPQGLDPADYVRTRGGEEFLAVAARALPLVEYMLVRGISGHDLATAEGRSRAVSTVLPIVAGLEDPVRREQYAGLLAERTGASTGAVMLELERMEGRRGGASQEGAAEAPRSSPQQRVEWEMLKVLAKDSVVLAAYGPRLSEDHFERAQHRKVFGMLVSSRGDVRALVASEDDEKLSRLIASLATEPAEGDVSRDYAERLWGRLEEFRLGRQIEVARKRLQPLNPIRDPEYDGLFEELIALEGARRKVREMAESSGVA
jgi:DNA primase